MPHRSVDSRLAPLWTSIRSCRTVDPKGFAVVPMVWHLAQKEEHSAYLSPGAGEDPFVKAKELISGLINMLKSQATLEASHKQPQVLLR